VTVHLRPFQVDLDAGIDAAWAGGAQNVLAVSPTGSGKTVLFSHKILQHKGASVAIAHRQELVGQISLALARNGVRHRIIGPQELVKRVIVPVHMAELGACLYDPNAPCAVAGVDTLIRMDPTPWFRQVTRWITDEAHHVLAENKWGQACAMFPNAQGLGVTALAHRADRKGLGRHADGVFDRMVLGPNQRDLISDGYLVDYRVFVSPEVVDVSEVPIGASGDFVQQKLREAVHRERRLVGNVVEHYLRHALGKRGITFAVDIESAIELAAAYRAAGVPAEVVSSKTPEPLRFSILRRFRAGEVLQLVNVDLLGEGVDVPGVYCVSMARHTASLQVFVQQLGRALRLLLPPHVLQNWGDLTRAERLAAIASSEKPRAIILDHVGNFSRMVAKYGMPDVTKAHTLDAGERRSRGGASDVIPIRACPMCTAAYLRVKTACPECGYTPVPAARTAPEQVDGDLTELDPATLAQLRGEAARIDGPPAYPPGLPAAAYGAMKRVHWERQQAQAKLREAMAWWAGYQKALGRPDRESYRRFFFMFGTDVATAQTLGRPEAEALTAQIVERLAVDGVVISGNTAPPPPGEIPT
jgi:DNA repair protein RadD